MSFVIILVALILLMFVAYRGFSVIMFAPLVAMGAVLFTDPTLVLPMFSGVFMEKMVGFIKLYFPVFMLGAIFGKLIELSGFSKSIVFYVSQLVGHERAILAIVLVCAILTYGGVSLFVVVFAVYPLAAEMFKLANIPKRLIPGTIALGAFTFTMDSLPGSPQIMNIIPTTFFKTTTWAAPRLGVIGGFFILSVGLAYLGWQRRKAIAKGEGYGTKLLNEPEPFQEEKLPALWKALLPLVLVGVLNKVFTDMVFGHYGKSFTLTLAGHPTTIQVASVAAIWAVLGALLVGILSVMVLAFRPVKAKFVDGTKVAIGGSLLATLNSASEYGFGAIIAALPGFIVVANVLKTLPNPLLNEAITVTTLSAITGSAAGGLSIALGAMADTFIAAGTAAKIPLEVLHRVASMASGGMDTLPHNGAVITLLAVTGLTHREAYLPIFAITLIKTMAVFLVIGIYYLSGLY
jgi:H+/gluconate symporter-like permease